MRLALPCLPTGGFENRCRLLFRSIDNRAGLGLGFTDRLLHRGRVPGSSNLAVQFLQCCFGLPDTAAEHLESQRMREGLDANLVHHETANSFGNCRLVWVPVAVSIALRNQRSEVRILSGVSKADAKWPFPLGQSILRTPRLFAYTTHAG